MSSLRICRSLVAITATPIVLAACGAPRTVDPNEPPTTVAVTLSNHDTPVVGEAVHILAPGESLPCCKLEVGDVRTVYLQMQHRALFQFLAVRNSSEVGRVTCQWNGEQAIGVDWIQGRLKCLVWHE